MSEYQVLARKYRPQQFKEVVGQEAVVATLLNALKRKKVAHAYLFCGTRGTGKTSLARLLAKALNCLNESEACEPCNQCPSCLEIMAGHSMDVIEIDGASHRGIEDIRQINETVGFAPSRGKYKIYIIDEVHMLTKEAFNALLKTLEEPPQKVKFFFATTEVNKVPLTIVSRCQRFNLRRIPNEAIEKKLKAIADSQSISLDPEAAEIIAHYSEGSLRDAQSLLDQTFAFAEDRQVTGTTATNALGLFPKELFFELAEAGKKKDYTIAFTLSKKVISSGVYLPHFLEELIIHFRRILLTFADLTNELSPDLKTRYQMIAPYYSEEQCLDLLEMLSEAQRELKSSLCEQVALEMLLLRILRSHQKISTERLVKKLEEIQQAAAGMTSSSPTPMQTTLFKQMEPKQSVQTEKPKEELAPIKQVQSDLLINKKSLTEEASPPLKEGAFQKVKKNAPKPPEQETLATSLTEDEKKQQQSRWDTVMRFAAKELDGSLKKE